MSREVPVFGDRGDWQRLDTVLIEGVETARYMLDVPDGFLSLLVSHPPWGWKASIAHQRRVAKADGSTFGRYPAWEEIVDARYRFLPHNVWIGMYLPPPQDYINIRPDSTVFHLDELPDPERAA